MADKDAKNPDNYDEYLPTAEEVDAWHSSEEFDSSLGDDAAAIEPDNVDANNDPMLSEQLSWDDDEEINPNKGLSFSAPASVEGEILVPLKDLKVWEHHPAAKSRMRAASFEALCESANDPAKMPPLEIIESESGYRIIDGRLRWVAFGMVHGTTSEISIRCQIFNGTEKEVLEKLADSAVGTTPRTQIEQARAIHNLQRVAGISQRAIAERYHALKKDQVSRMTIAARTVERFPQVFNLLAEPDRVPIDTCVKFAQWVKAASEEMRADMLKTAEALESEFFARSGSGGGELGLLKPAELFNALGIKIEGGSKSKASSPAEVSDVLESIDIFGEDDTPVGVVEKLDERVMRFQLPDPLSMSPEQREIAAQGYIRQILDYFSLRGTA